MSRSLQSSGSNNTLSLPILHPDSTTHENCQGVQQIEDHAGDPAPGNSSREDPSEQTDEKIANPSAYQRIGRWRSAILLLSFVSIAASLSYLCWLWNSDPKDLNWTRIVRAEWVISSATIASIAIRIASSAQAVVATSMLAALFLEVRGVKLQHAAEFSILRFSNSGPLTSLWAFIGNTHRLGDILLLILILLLAIITTALQFTSFILLHDVKEGLLLGPLESSIQSTGRKSFGNFKSNNYWTVTPITFANFLEYSEPSKLQDGIADTGVSVRGFLPLRNQSLRHALRSYTGPAALFDTRVICSRPNITFSAFGHTEPDPSSLYFNSTSTRLLQLKGQISSNLTLPELVHNTSKPINFDCSILVEENVRGNSTMQLCQLGSGLIEKVGGLISRLDPLGRTSEQYQETHEADISFQTQWKLPDIPDWMIFTGHSYLLWHIPSSCSEIHADISCAMDQVNISNTQSGPWQNFSIGNSSSTTEIMHVSVCYDAIGDVGFSTVQIPHDFNVSVSLDQGLPQEPTVAVDSDHDEINTYLIRKQLSATSDATNLSAQDRGIIPLDIGKIEQQKIIMARAARAAIKSNGTFGPDWNTSVTFMWENIWDSLPGMRLQLEINATKLFFIINENITGPNMVLDRIFMDTLEDTQNPAVALQAMWTTVLRTAYYDAVSLSRPDQEVTMQLVSRHQMAQSQRGLMAVMMLSVAHWIVTMIVVALFVLEGRYVVLDKAWAAVLDVWTPEGEALLGDEPNSARIAMHDERQEAEPHLGRIVRLRGSG